MGDEDESDGWLPIEEAPKDSQIKLSFWRDQPVLICWFPALPAKQKMRRQWIAPFFSKEVVEEISGEEAGWRVLSWSPRLGWGINGNCKPFTPKWWKPITYPPGIGDAEAMSSIYVDDEEA